MKTSKIWTIWYPYSSQEEWNANALTGFKKVNYDQDSEESEESEDDDWFTRGCDLYHARKDDGYYAD